MLIYDINPPYHLPNSTSVLARDTNYKWGRKARDRFEAQRIIDLSEEKYKKGLIGYYKEFTIWKPKPIIDMGGIKQCLQ